MLLQIRDFIRLGGLVSTQQMSREFCIDRFALQPMLDLLVKNHLIQKSEQDTTCQSTCFKCQSKNIEYYQLADGVT